MRRMPIAVAATAALIAGAASAQWKDLRVLPADVDRDALDATMKRMGREIGASCAYCHAKDDPAAETPQKAKARDMIRMTIALNRDWFGYPNAPEVSCITCHRGRTTPRTR